MSTEIKKEIALEIAHVLFVDIVGYSKLSINDQPAAIDELTQVVRTSEQFQNAEAAARLIKIPTGDGMALVFYKSPEEPVKCALEISRALKEHPKLQLRMGAHSGPVSGVIDVNGQANLAGAGLNTAQRVMACGDAGHILLSRHVAEDLALTNMALGDKATALALLERTMAAVPIEKDALNGPGPIEILARVAAQMGGTRPRHRRFTKATLDTVHWRAG
jgi:class 3 adenylate cyclase